MSKHLTGVMVAVFAAAAFVTAPTFADHRPGNVVVMGGTLSLTGRYAVPAGRNFNAHKLYIEELNARGGLLGHKVEYTILDDKSDKQTAIKLYKKLFTEGKVDLVLGPYSSYLTDAVANISERYKHPIIAHASATIIYERGRKYVFNDGGIAEDFQKGALNLAQQMGVERIAIIGAGSLFPRQVTEGALKWAKKLDLNVVLLESYRREQRDFTALLRRIEASGAEAIISNSYFADSVAQTRQLRDLNINMKLFSATVGPALPKFVKDLGGTADYVLGFTLWEPKPSHGHPGMKAFIEKYEKRYGVKPNYHAASNWMALQVLEAAVKAAGSFDPEKIRDALASITVDTVKGSWKADERGVSSLGGLTFQIQNGERVIVWPATMSEAKFLPMPKWEDRAKK